jgi:hypothetical protein
MHPADIHAVPSEISAPPAIMSDSVMMDVAAIDPNPAAIEPEVRTPTCLSWD